MTDLNFQSVVGNDEDEKNECADANQGLDSN